MIYVFGPANFGHRMTNIGKDITILALGPQAFSDFDLRSESERALNELQALKREIGHLPLSASLLAQWRDCEERLGRLTDRDREIGATLLHQFQTNLLRELVTGLFLAVDNADARLFQDTEPFGDMVSALFPKATTDICEGAKCLALERYTAATFHFMRAAEHALRYLATDIGVAEVEKRDFGQLVQETSDKCDALNARDPQKKRLAEALVSLNLFKDAWRNPVFHARDDHYTEQRARDVYNGTRAFMQSLARRAAANATTSP